MNRKFEDKLVELAFGDVGPEEAKRLEARAATDPKAATALHSYREIREGLRSLADVPEHQLSNERLRDAILVHGLRQEPVEKPASSSRGWGWLWMPVATCALAFAIVVVRNHPSQPTGSPELVGVDSAAGRLADATMPAPRFTVPTPSPATVAKKSEPPKASSLSEQPPVRLAMNDEGTPWRRRHYNLASRRKSARQAESNGPIVFHAPPVDGDLPPSLASNETQLETKADNLSKDQPIVLIASDKDAGTGTQVATEVESASNVLVGG